MFVPASSARLVSVPGCMLAFALIVPLWTSICPVDTILTRMGAYDNMFSNASTFKVELDEWFASFLQNFWGHGRQTLIHSSNSCKILRDATPKSLVILDGEVDAAAGSFALDVTCLFLQNSEGVLRRTTEWRLQGYVIYSVSCF
jgi:hypothetical protein